MNTFWANPAVVGLIIAIPATVLGYLGYRRSRGMDDAAKQAGVVGGWNDFIKNVQRDNRDLRQQMEKCTARLDALETGNIDLRAKNRELERENETLHTENRALKVEIEALKARIGELEKASGKQEEASL